MERSSSSVNNHAGRNEHLPRNVGPMSSLSAQTLSRIQGSLCRRRFRDPRTRYIIHDNNSPGYEWLLPGWLAEERHMSHGRVYRVTYLHCRIKKRYIVTFNPTIYL